MLAVSRRQICNTHHHGQIGGIEVGVPSWCTQDLGTQSQIAFDEGRRLNRQAVIELFDWQGQTWPHMVLNIGQMRVTQLLPYAGGHIATDHPVVQHRNAGTADHGIQAVALHELKQRTPQGHDHRALAVICVHAAAAQLDHAVAQAAQAGQVKFGVAVRAARAFRLGRGEHTVSANHHTRGAVTHQQVLAIVVKQIDVVARHLARQARTHLGAEHIESQFLCFTNFVLMLRPRDPNSALDSARQEIHSGVGLWWMK